MQRTRHKKVSGAAQAADAESAPVPHATEKTSKFVFSAVLASGANSAGAGGGAHACAMLKGV